MLALSAAAGLREESVDKSGNTPSVCDSLANATRPLLQLNENVLVFIILWRVRFEGRPLPTCLRRIIACMVIWYDMKAST